MTEEELQAKLEETTNELNRLKGENDKLSKNQSEQNAYITKLEEIKNGLSAQVNNIQEAANKPALDPNITAYFKKKYVQEFANEGKAAIIANDTMNAFPLLEKELDTFLKQFMNEGNASVKFILDSYSLILGRAIADPEHPINKKKDEGVKDETVQPEPTPTLVDPLFPPTLTDEDKGAGNPAAKQTINIPDTKSAFKVLEDRLFNQGRDKFE